MNIRLLIKNVFYGIRGVSRIPIDSFSHNSIPFSNTISENVSLKFTTMGKHNFVARRCSFYNVVTGNYCCFGPDIHIGGMQHSWWWYSMSPLLSDECKSPEQTVIGNDVWMGASCVIKQGVKIGDGAVIGANSFVNKDVPPFAIVAGSPAKIIKYRFSEDVQRAILNSRYWEYEPEKALEILNGLNAL